MRRLGGLLFGSILLIGAVVVFRLLASDLKYEPGYETLWMDSFSWSMAAALAIAVWLLLAGRRVLVRARRRLARGIGWLACGTGATGSFGIIGLVLLVGGSGMLRMGDTKLHRLEAPDGTRMIVRTDSFLSSSVHLYVWDEKEGWSERERCDTVADGPLALRESLSRGRYLVIGSEEVLGAIVDLGARDLLTAKADTLELDEVRREFGEDLWFSYPGYGGRPLPEDEGR